MNSLKKEILFVLLFMIIGAAAVTTNLVINGTVNVAKNPDDFLVYFSDVKVNGTQDLSLVENETKLVFDGEFSAIGDKKVISYDVTNASKNYDAAITISCTESTDYLTITNVFDTTSYLSARSTKTGTLTVELTTAVSEETSQEVTCTLSASAVERTSQGSGDVSVSLEKRIAIGDEISIGNEKFNVISTTDDTVTMLAQYNLGTDYKQNLDANHVRLNVPGGWGATDVATDFDIFTYSTNAALYVNSYVSFLQTEFNETNITGNLITLIQLRDLGCTINETYEDNGNTCVGSPYTSWLVNSQNWSTRSADLHDNNDYFYVTTTGGITSTDVGGNGGIRPIVTIPVSLAKQYKV